MNQIDLSYLPYKLKQEQLDALDFCYNRKTAIMSLGTGVGKTITVCCLVKQLLEDIPNSIAVFIVPAKAIKAFRKELSICNLSYHLWTSDEMKNTSGARILITTHTALHKYVNTFKKMLVKYECIGVVDEIHNFTVNYDTDPYTINKRTQALLDIRPLFSHFYALTATTIKNDAMSLYTMSNIVRPQYFGSPQQFQNRYCNTKQSFYKIKTRWGTQKTITKTVITGFKSSRELEIKKSDLIIFRQLSYNIEFNDIDIPLDEGLWERYTYIGSGQLPLKETKSKMSEYSLRLITLQRLMDNDVIKDKDDKIIFAPVELSNKEKALLDLVRKLLKEGHIPLIYCFYLNTIERVKNILEESDIPINEIFVISGQIPQRERARVEDKIAPNTVTIFNRAGTESINLQKADTIIYYNLPWSIDEYLQSIGRITRNDTKFDKQLIYFLQYEGTVDNYRTFIIKNRINLIEQIQGEQLDTSDDIKLSTEDTKKLKKLLLWCCSQDRPVTKEELLEEIKKSN